MENKIDILGISKFAHRKKTHTHHQSTDSLPSKLETVHEADEFEYCSHFGDDGLNICRNVNHMFEGDEVHAKSQLDQDEKLCKCARSLCSDSYHTSNIFSGQAPNVLARTQIACILSNEQKANNAMNRNNNKATKTVKMRQQNPRSAIPEEITHKSVDHLTKQTSRFKQLNDGELTESELEKDDTLGEARTCGENKRDINALECDLLRKNLEIATNDLNHRSVLQVKPKYGKQWLFTGCEDTLCEDVTEDQNATNEIMNKFSELNRTGKTSDVKHTEPLCQSCMTVGNGERIRRDHVIVAHTNERLHSSLQSVVRSKRTGNRLADGSILAHRDTYNGQEEAHNLQISLSANQASTMPEKSSRGTVHVQTKDSHMTKVTEIDRTETDDNKKAGVKQVSPASVLPVIAEALSKISNDESTENGKTDISQTVTKLNGGNLVITTMTRKIEESIEEKEENKTDVTSGSTFPSEGSEYGDMFLVQNCKGDLYVLEDLTGDNDDSQESAYYSSSERHASESSLIHENISTGSESPVSQRVQNLRAVGESSLDYSTAEDVISRMYEDNEKNSRSLTMQTNGYETPLYHGYKSDNESYRTECSFNIRDLPPANKMSTFASTYSTVDGSSGVASHVSTLPRHVNDMESEVSLSENDNYAKKQHRTQTADGGNKTSASYIFESSVTLAPQPVQPQYRVVNVDMTPGPFKQKSPQEIEKYKIVKSASSESPVYTSVAIIKGKDLTPPVVQDGQRTFKIITARATSAAGQVVQNDNMDLDQTDSREQIIHNRKSTNIEGYTSKRTILDECDASWKNQHSFERNPVAVRSVTERPRATERVKHKTRIAVFHENTDNVESSRVEEQKSETIINESDMHVVHGSILIKNRIDHNESDDAFDDNINLFDNEFSLNKENPLYQSDEDIYKRIEREEDIRIQEQEALDMSKSQDITFETVDKFTKSKQVKRDERPKKQKLSELLLSRLSTIDSRDIRQHIGVKHHNEEIFGDPRFTDADSSHMESDYTKNFDSVSENVYLTMKEGKACITIKVTAERIMPIDIEFNVWRKSAAIVTREIEIDLSATEQRRRLYQNLMETSGSSDGFDSDMKFQETALSGNETLDVFSKIMDVAEAKRDDENSTVQTSQNKTFLPPDFLY